MNIPLYSAVIVLFLSAGNASAEVYKCKDEKGKVVFSDVQCASNAEVQTHINPKPQYQPSNLPSGIGYSPSRISSPWDNAPTIEFRTLPIEDMDAARQRFEAFKPKIVYNLKDPSSAMFRNVRAARVEYLGEEHTFICGQINAKNSYGAYSGYEPFFVERNGFGEDDPQIGDKNLTSLKKIQDKWYGFKPVVSHCLTQGEVLVE